MSLRVIEKGVNDCAFISVIDWLFTYTIEEKDADPRNDFNVTVFMNLRGNLVVVFLVWIKKQ